jgi:hypothetical protein
VLKQLRTRLTFANVMSCIALFLALGGAAFAAKTATKVKTKNLANGAVTTSKLRNGAVTTAKLRNEAVTTAKVAPGAIGTGQLAKGSVRSEQLGGGVVTEAKIKNGAVSASKLDSTLYAALLKNVSYIVKASVSNSEAKSETAQCPNGTHLISGGARLLGANTQLALTESAPVINGGEKWSAAAVEFAPESENWSIQVFAICAEI